jgi:FlaA1/EpsC-like NDP-sugar epimerase
MTAFDFPSDIWQAAGVRGAAAAPLALSDLAVEVERWHGAPRDEATLARYVREHLPAGRIALYGAGSHSRLLLRLLARRPDITIVVIVDRRADAIGEFEGHPVTATVPDAAIDYVLAAHTSYEGEMARALMAQGVPADRILCLYAPRTAPWPCPSPTPWRPGRPGRRRMP